MALFINDRISIPEEALREQNIHASGPGGQHVNKAATGVRLMLDLNHTPFLPESVGKRLRLLAKNLISRDGVLAISATSFRERPRNQEEAREKLRALILKATIKPKYRVPTKPGKAAKKRRLDDKAKRSKTKQMRRKVGRDDHRSHRVV